MCDPLRSTTPYRLLQWAAADNRRRSIPAPLVSSDFRQNLTMAVTVWLCAFRELRRLSGSIVCPAPALAVHRRDQSSLQQLMGRLLRAKPIGELSCPFCWRRPSFGGYPQGGRRHHQTLSTPCLDSDAASFRRTAPLIILLDTWRSLKPPPLSILLAQPRHRQDTDELTGRQDTDGLTGRQDTDGLKDAADCVSGVNEQTSLNLQPLTILLFR